MSQNKGLSELRSILRAREPSPVTPLTAEELALRIAEFARDVENMSDDEILDRYIASRSSPVVKEELWTSIEAAIHAEFAISSGVHLVGSGKIGFSPVKTVEKGAIKPFDADSDLDVALVNSDLFDRIWEECYISSLDINNWSKKSEFNSYFFQGWIRPDLLPYQFDRRAHWFDFFARLGDQTLNKWHPIRAGLYKSERFFLNYHKKSIRSFRSRERAGR